MSFFNTPNTSWKKLQKDSENYHKPVLYPNAFDYTNEFETAIHSLVQLYATNEIVKNLAPQLRLYVNQEAVDIHSYFSTEQVIKPEESIQEWGKRIFKDQDYILVINCVERFSETFSSHFAKLMAPRLNDYSPDEVSYRITLFIGNSGFTPFGAHIDLPGLDVTHFHLGPGSKSMTLWKEDQFKELTNSQEKHCYDFENQLEYGQKYYLNKGDVFFFPADRYYHVGEYHEFSMAAAVGIIKESPYSFYKKAMSTWDEDIKQHLNQEIPTEEQGFKKLTQQIPKNIRDTSILEIIEVYKKKKESNAFMHHRPIRKKLRPIFLINKRVQLNDPFRILVISEKNQIFSRGRKLDMTLNTETEHLLAQLNKGEIISCNQGMPENTLKLMTWLFNTGSIIFC